MNRAFLIIGGNLGDREMYLRSTVEEIETNVGKIVCKSDIYESEPWGFGHKSQFLNQVLEVRTNLSALCLLDACNLIEEKLGRERYSDVYTARTVDIDILFYNDCTYTLPPLIVPHRLLQERMFVLEPLSQIAPDLTHPLLGVSISDLKKRCEDQCRVWKYEPSELTVNA